MARIIRLTEQDLARIVRRVIMEQFTQNTPLDFMTVTGYKSSLFPQVQYGPNGTNWNFTFSGSKTLGNMMNMVGGDFQSAQNEYSATDLSARSAFVIDFTSKPKTKAEVTARVKVAPTEDGKKDPFTIKAGGSYKNKEGKTVTWGRLGFTAGSEMVDAICKLLSIVE
jgi:hypothetical protein